VQTAVAPRFSRTPGAIQNPPVVEGKDSLALLSELGYSAQQCESLLGSGAVTASE